MPGGAGFLPSTVFKGIFGLVKYHNFARILFLMDLVLGGSSQDLFQVVFITMVRSFLSPKYSGLWATFQMAFLWLIHGGY